MLLKYLALLSADRDLTAPPGSLDQSLLVPEPTSNYIKKTLQPLTLTVVSGYAGGALRAGDAARTAVGISTDSRAVGHGELFLALRGDKFDGHRFVADVAAGGGLGAVVARDFFRVAELPPGFAIVEVDDTLLAYQRIAAHYRRSLPLRVVAITGSNGKTSTKDFTAAALGNKFRVLKTEGNFNNHIGVPRMLLRAEPADEIAVLEMGMNHPGEIAPLAVMAAPQVAIITNVGTAHIEYMKTRAAIAREKGVLAEAVDSTGTVVLNAEDDFTASIAARTSALVIRVGLDRGDLRAEKFQQTIEGSRFEVVSDTGRVEAMLPVAGRHMVLNALLALAAAQACGSTLEEAVAGLSQARLTKGRLELKRVRGLQILDDTYNANPDSMTAALQTLARVPADGRRIAVLGRMGELGDQAEAGHRRVGEAAAAENIDQLIGVGTEARLIVESAREAGLRDATAVETVEEAAALLQRTARAGDTILVKGSRSAAMERVIAALSQSSPPIQAEPDAPTPL